MKLSSIEEARRDNLVKLQEKINEAKAKFIRGIDDRIKTIIRDCVALQVSRRVEDHVSVLLHFLGTQLTMGSRLQSVQVFSANF
jgi:hypothetical protein